MKSIRPPDLHERRNETAADRRRIKTRVRLNLDEQGLLVSVQIEPAAWRGIRKTAIVQTHNLLAKANDLLFAIANHPATIFAASGDDEKVADENTNKQYGYALARQQMRELPQFAAMRDAMADLRHYLQATPEAAMREAEKKIRYPGER
jgi:hypothetical protein